MIPDPWTQFAWNLDFLPESFSKLPQPLALREASKSDFQGIQEVVRLSFSFDVAWSGSYRYWQDNLSRRIARCASKSSVPGLVIAHGNRIIAASVLDTEADSDHHLVTGPCVLMEYRNRGIGSHLLHASLLALRQAGLPVARGYCRETSPTAKFVYKKFGAANNPIEANPFSA
jgi:ribosomal protein S18 acetylase RimI-like enzyme